VVEHFHHPAEEFARLDALLRPGGWLGIMTCFQTDDARFARWHYRRDPTHVVFYREATFRVIARRHGWVCEIPAKDVVLMCKPAC
ncbi:MAG: methyltransferase domain-containing protein, partial [Proteobacteria bacterium]|nr:methyltransferase domain-containing protein [Pseudomonadota bacterium]